MATEVTQTGGRQRELIVAPDAGSFIGSAVRIFTERAREAVASRDSFSVALSGAKTPQPLYARLASDPYRSEVAWDKTQLFFSDERFVPPDSPESNLGMANQAMLSKVPIPERFVHPVATEGVSPEESAALYEEGMRRIFRVGLSEIPRFDLIFLGVGADGHTASLFPGTEALDVTDALVVASQKPADGSWRITFNYPLINAARTVLVLVDGAAKSDAVARALEGEELPIARVKPQDGELIWVLDEAAASGIRGQPRDVL